MIWSSRGCLFACIKAIDAKQSIRLYSIFQSFWLLLPVLLELPKHSKGRSESAKSHCENFEGPVEKERPSMTENEVALRIRNKQPRPEGNKNTSRKQRTNEKTVFAYHILEAGRWYAAASKALGCSVTATVGLDRPVCLIYSMRLFPCVCGSYPGAVNTVQQEANAKLLKFPTAFKFGLFQLRGSIETLSSPSAG